MADYLTKQGVAAGPIYITTIKDTSHTGNWIVSDGSCLHIGSTWKLNSNNLLSSYNHILAESKLPRTDIREPYMLVNAQWVRNYVTGGSGGGGSGSTGVSQTDFEDFKKVVLGNRLSYTAPSVLKVAEDAQSSATQAITRLDALDNSTAILERKIELISSNLTKHVEDFNEHMEDFNSYKNNPYPEGVIFIGGGANNA